jgi:two-component system cell cycle response regulator
MILPHTDGAMAVRVAERVRNAVRDFVFLADDHPTHITVSAGVATYPSFDDVDSVDALVRAADMALYAAKNQGRDRVIRDDATHRSRLGRGFPRSQDDGTVH